MLLRFALGYVLTQQSGTATNLLMCVLRCVWSKWLEHTAETGDVEHGNDVPA